MNGAELKKVFPEATTKPDDTQDYLPLKIDGQTWFVAKNNLSKRELFLLKSLSIGQSSVARSYTPWQNYLINQQNQPLIRANLRFIYFRVGGLIPERKNEWMELILSFFSSETSSFWDNRSSLIIIDEECTLTQNDIIGIVTAIDGDFETKTEVLIGLVWNKTDDLPKVFKEERLMGANFKDLKKVLTVPEIALQFYLARSTKNSIILQTYRKKLASSSELITSLYKVGGNVTQASKNMYIHRNTLEYRIDKLQDRTNLNLRKMDDLVFSYLIIS